MRGTVRAFSRDDDDAGRGQACGGSPTGVAAGVRRDRQRSISASVFPPLVNDADETRFIAEMRRRARRRGQRQSRTATSTMASEDFSYMLERVPGAYIQIGNGDGEGGCEVHNPGYDFNDVALPLGASLFVRLVERRLARLGRDEAGRDEAGAGAA